MIETAPIHLGLFRDMPDLENFGAQTLSTYHACLECSEIAGRRTAGVGQAIMLTRLVVRMLEYKGETARQMTGAGIEAIDAEIDAVWPTFKAVIDAELEEAAEAFRMLREAASEKAN
jgi:hypothetical protein